MQAIREIVDSSIFNNVIHLPNEMKNKKVEVIIIPLNNKEKDDIFSDIQNKLKRRKVKKYTEDEVEDIIHEVRGIKK